MPSIREISVPKNALLETYAERTGAYVDCYCVDANGNIGLGTFVECFFNTRLMKLERRLIGMNGKPSTEEDVRTLAHGTGESLAWWRVERREPDQLLLSVSRIATRTFLMVTEIPGSTTKTRLFFGSALLKPSRLSRILLPFHKAYSRLLLRSAARACERRRRVGLP